MDPLTLFGLAAVTAMLLFYALEDHSPWFVTERVQQKWAPVLRPNARSF
jgi:hypothetical protein